MTDQEIMTYWYKYLYRNYPFIQWKVEVNIDNRQLYPIFIKFEAINLVCKFRDAIIQRYPIYSSDRNIKLQNKMMASEIKRMVASLKARSTKELKQDIP